MAMAMATRYGGGGIWRAAARRGDAFGDSATSGFPGSNSGSNLRDETRTSLSSHRPTLVKRPASPSAGLVQALRLPPSLAGYLLKLSTRRAWRVSATEGTGAHGLILSGEWAERSSS